MLAFGEDSEEAVFGIEGCPAGGVGIWLRGGAAAGGDGEAEVWGLISLGGGRGGGVQGGEFGGEGHT